MLAIGEPALSEPGQIAGRECYRVRLNGTAGAAVFWIDQDELTRCDASSCLPSTLREDMSQDGPIDAVSVVAEFTGAQLNGDVDPKAFEFEVPKDAKLVEFITPPHMGQLLNKKAPEFKFTDVAGKAVTPETIAGKTAVLAFWSIRYESCRRTVEAT